MTRSCLEMSSREAHSEGQALRCRLLKAEGRISGLEADNARMRSDLGEEPLPDSPPSPTSPTGPAFYSITSD